MNSHSDLKLRDGNLINNWYIGCLSEELKPMKAISRTIYDTHLVIFRDESGHPKALLDRCLHRGVKLSEGSCVKGQLQCPYHGWIYNGSGCVTNIPSEGNVLKNKSLKAIDFKCIEQDGAIWIWMGDSTNEVQPTPPWRFPKYNDSRLTKYFMITDFDNEVTHLAENFMDVPHTVFVHRGWFRNQKMTHVPISLEVKNAQVLVTYHQPNDSIGFSKLLINPKGHPMVHTDQFIFPNITRVDYRFGNDSEFIINSQITPITTLKSRVYTYIAYKSLGYGKLIKPFMKFYTRKVIQQDVEIMENQGSNFKRFVDMNFRSTEADEVHLAIEKIRTLGVKKSEDTKRYTKTSEREIWI